MSARTSAAALFLIVSLFACGSGEETPPLDELALRDSLLAEPSVIAQLRPDVRQRLRARFVSERLRADAITEFTPQQDTPLANQVLGMDATRFSAGRDALIAGSWQQVDHTGQNGQRTQAVAFTAPVAEQPTSTLPPMQGDMSGDTILMEQRALAGEAGAVIEQLLQTSNAQRVERVIAWPIAALSAGGTVYVNASWLTAMDKIGCSSGSNGGGSNSGGTAPAGAAQQNGSYMYLVGGETAGTAQQGGSEGSGEAGKEGVNRASGFGSCDSCSSSFDGCNKACDSTSSSCNSTSSSCSSCNDPTGDKACCRACSTTSVAPRSPLVAYGALFWLMLPLGFLMLIEGRGNRLRRIMSRVRGRRS